MQATRREAEKQQRKEGQRQQVYEDNKPDHASLKEKIEDWLEAEGITFSNVRDFNSHFHISANLKNVEIHMSESKVRRGVLAVHGVVALSDSQLATLEKVKPEDKRPLFLSIFRKLDRSEYHFMLQEDFTSKSWLRIQRTLYVEDLTRTLLLGAMKDLNTKFVDVNYEVDDALENLVAPGSEEKSAIYT